MAHLPHLTPSERQPIVFLTACTAERRQILANETAHEILHEIWSESLVRNGWAVGAYVILPDHVHRFARATRDARPLAVWIRLWKSLSATRLNRVKLSRETGWHADYFDRFLRSAGDYSLKGEYVALNPVRKGLVARVGDWPFSGVIHELRA